jgi:prophage antirepressor-like protein
MRDLEKSGFVKNGQFWFVGKDVTNILDYQNGRRAINMHIDNEDKGVSKCDTPGGKLRRNWRGVSL